MYDKASLVMIPSGTKTSKIFSQKPTSGDGDFTFTRSTYATRVNSQGLIEKERGNLLLQSNNFDTTWTNIVTTLTGGQSGYDGSSDAWLLNSTTTGFPRIEQSVTLSGVQTFSIYAKSATDSFIQVRTFGAASEVWFNLSTGVASTSSGAGYITSKVESIGSGWYRCSLTVNGSLTSIRVYPASAIGTYSTSGNGVYIQDAQLEQGLVATDYIETTTAAVYTGITDNVPRLDYDGDCPSLLLEPQRTNEVTHSEYFGGYTNSNSTDTPNDTTSPEGVSNGTSFKEQATTGQHKLVTISTFDGSSTYTFSIFAKYNGRDLFIDTQNSNEWGGRAWFDLSLGTANAILGSASIEDYGDGWYRCIVTGDSSLSGSNNVELLTSDGSTNSTTGDTTKGVYIYGAQLEEGSYATSYIPTYGTSVTRNEDLCTNAGDSTIFNNDEGVLYMEISTKTDNTDKTISLNNGVVGSNNNRLWMGYSTSSKRVYALGYVNNSLQFALNKLMTDETLFVKIACKYALNDVSFFVNGEKVETDTSALAFTELNTLDFNIGNGNGGAPFYGKCKAVAYFNRALTDTELADLTT